MPSVILKALRQKPARVKGDGSKLYDCPICKGSLRLEVHVTRPVWFCHKCGLGGRTGANQGEVPEKSYFESWNDGDFLEEYKPCKPDSFWWNELRTQRVLGDYHLEQLLPHQGPLAGVAYFPCYDCDSRIPCYFIGKPLVENSLPWIAPPLYAMPKKKSEVVWGLHRIRPRMKELVICEGPLDAIWGPNRVALLGKSLSETQAQIISLYQPQTVVIMLDGDAKQAAADMAVYIADWWSVEIKIADIPMDFDPGDLRKSGDHYIEKARTVA